MLGSLFDVAMVGFSAAIFVIALLATLIVGLFVILYSIYLISRGIERFKDWRANRGE